MNNYDNTIDANKAQNQNQTKVNNKSNNGAKIAAGVGAAAVLGAGAVYGASQAMGEDIPTEEQAQTTQPEQPVEQPVEQPAQPEEHHHHHHHEKDEPKENKVGGGKVEEDTHHKLEGVEINSIEAKADEEGNIVHVAEGTVDGHDAMFVDDGKGNVELEAVDFNDNGEYEENEIYNVEDQKITMGDLADNMITNDDDPKPVIVKDDDPKIEVVSVDFEEGMGNVAVVNVDDDQIMLVDTNLDDDADYLIHDDNGNQEIEDEEIHELAQGSVHMPTEDDIQNNNQLASNDEQDYNNTADVTTYEV